MCKPVGSGAAGRPTFQDNFFFFPLAFQLRGRARASEARDAMNFELRTLSRSYITACIVLCDVSRRIYARR